MARLHFVKKARKDIPGTDIKAGDSYYWWKFRFGPKRTSKTRPPRSALTQSSFYAQLWDIEDMIGELEAGPDLADSREEIVDLLRSLAEECEDNRSNMPDALQDSETGELLQERADALNAAADEFDGIDMPSSEDEPGDLDTAEDEVKIMQWEEEWQRVLDEMLAVDLGIG